MYILRLKDFNKSTFRYQSKGMWLSILEGAMDLLLFSHVWHCNSMDCSMPDCPPLSPRVCSNSYPLSWWCYLTISSSATPFSFCLHSFPASESFQLSWLFTLGGQSIRVSANPSNENSGLTSFNWLNLSPCSPRDS